MKPSAPKKPHSPLFWIGVVVLPLALIISGLWVSNYMYNLQVDHEDDIKFAKIETYVDLIKKQLDREIPEGKWVIEKDCHKPGTKGSFEEYGCEYGITSEVSASFKEQQLNIVRSFSSRDLYVDDNKVTYGMYPPIENVGCDTFYERDAANISGLRCTSSSHKVRYPLAVR